MSPRLPTLMLVLSLLALAPAARAQMPGGGPPAVGIARVEHTAITETSEFVGRVQAINRVALTARVTAFLEQRLFTEGTEVQQGDRLANANLQLSRAQSLLNTPAGQRSSVDDALANQRSQAAQLMSAQAQLKAAQINLAYTEIRAPVAGTISRTAITIGNVVSPSSGSLATIVSQDPMYVLFPVATRVQDELKNRYADRGGLGAAVVKLRLANGSMYGQEGKIDYVDPTVATNTDTVLIRAKIGNPPRRPVEPNEPVDRQLIDGEFVTVLVEGMEPIQVLGIPRRAVLSDQQGDYVYVVGADNKVEQRRIHLGQSTPSVAVVDNGLKEGEMVVVDGIQRVRPGITVSPGPASPPPSGPSR